MSKITVQVELDQANVTDVESAVAIVTALGDQASTSWLEPASLVKGITLISLDEADVVESTDATVTA
jgi:hypothetical protein